MEPGQGLRVPRSHRDVPGVEMLTEQALHI